MMGLTGWIEGMSVFQGLCAALGGLLLLVFLGAYGPTGRLARPVLKHTGQVCALLGVVLVVGLVIHPQINEAYRVTYATAVVLLMLPRLAWVVVSANQEPGYTQHNARKTRRKLPSLGRHDI